VRAASIVLAPSRFTRGQILEKFAVDAGRVRIAPIAIDSSLAAALEAGTRVEPAVPVVLSVGNVLPRKNLITVATAIRRLRARAVDVRYRVVGQVSPQGAATERHLRRTLPDIDITGYVSDEQLARHYHSASVLAFPSLFEGYGLPVIEAMQARLPVICSSSTSLPEIAGDACTVLDPLDVAAWEASIERLVTDRATWHRASRRGLARASEFDWHETARLVADSLVTAGAAAQRVPAAA
jgi:glycosyltransferase involved in cell wall biosynthesis